MSSISRTLAVALAATGGAACAADDPNVVTELPVGDTPVQRDRSAEAMLAVVNQSVPILMNILYEKTPPPPSPIAVVGLKKEVGDNIIAFRVGPDAMAGTTDDREFATVTELDDIVGVGPIQLQQILTYAIANGFRNCDNGAISFASEYHTSQISTNPYVYETTNQNCVVLVDGTAWCDHRRARQYETPVYQEATWFAASHDISEVSVAADHRCLRGNDDSVRCVSDAKGSDGATPLRYPTPVEGLPPMIQIDGWGGETCGVSDRGYVLCWHISYTGRYPYQPYFEMYQVPGVFNATSVAVGKEAACASTLDGKLWCWGAAVAGYTPGGLAIHKKLTSTTAVIVKVGMVDTTAYALSAGGGLYSGSMSQTTPFSGSTQVTLDINDGCRETANGWSCAGVSGIPGIDGIPQAIVKLSPSCAVRRDGAVMCWTTDPAFSKLLATPCDL